MIEQKVPKDRSQLLASRNSPTSRERFSVQPEMDPSLQKGRAEFKLTHGIHRASKTRGHATATIFGGRRRTWAEVRDRIARLAAGLIAAGLQKGDRVAIVSKNSDLYIETFYAIAWAGGVSVPGNFRWSEAEHEYALKDSSPRFLMLGEGCEALAEPMAAACGTMPIIMGEMRGSGVLSTEAMIESCDPMEDNCGQGRELCAIFYTGGTTGRPKGVMLSHAGLMFSFFAVHTTVPLPPDPIFLHLPPMFHVAGTGAVIATTMFCGTHVVLPNFNPAAAVEAVSTERVNVALLVPTMFRMLREHLEENPADLSSVSLVRYGASPISETLLRDAIAIFPNAIFTQGYGQTELSPIATMLEPRFHANVGGKSYLRSAGRPVFGVEVKIVDGDLNECALGKVGEVLVHSPGAMLGYLNLPELTAATIVNGWVRTGDAGYMDEDGFLYIVDRVKDMIISGGENVYSAEVENTLNKHDAVAECAVIGVPDPRWGERVHAIVRLKDGKAATEDELIDHSKSFLAHYKCPRSLELRSTPLPLSPQGKILKTELRKPFWDGFGSNVG